MKRTRLVAVLAAGALLVVAGCGPTDPNDPKTWVAKLKSPERITAIRRLASMGSRAHVAVPELIKLYDKGRAKAEIVNALVLMKATGPEVVRVMSAAMVDSTEQNAAAAAADYLGELDARDRLKDLLAVVDTEMGDEVKAAAMRSVVKLKDPSVTDDLIRILDRDVAKQWIHLNALACQALGEIGPPAARKALPSIVKGIFLKDRFGRMAYRECAIALVKFGDEAGKALLDALEGRNKAVSEYIRAQNWVDGLLESEVLKALALVRYPDAAPAIIQQLVARDEPPKGYDEGQKQQWAIIEATRFQNAVDALGLLGNPAALDALDAWLYKGDYLRRVRVPWAIQAIGGRKAYESLLRAARTASIEDVEGKKTNVIRIDYLLYLSYLAGPDDIADLEGLYATVEKMRAEVDGTDFTAKIDGIRKVMDATKDCGNRRECWAGKLRDQSTHVAEKAVWFLARVAREDAASLDALLSSADTENIAIRNAILDVLPRVCDRRCVEPIRKLVAAEEGKSRGKGFKDRYDFVLAQVGRQGS